MAALHMAGGQAVHMTVSHQIRGFLFDRPPKDSRLSNMRYTIELSAVKWLPGQEPVGRRHLRALIRRIHQPDIAGNSLYFVVQTDRGPRGFMLKNLAGKNHAPFARTPGDR